MAAESTTGEIQAGKSQHIHKVVLSHGDLDGHFDLISDESVNHVIDNSDVDEDYLDGLDDFELKDLDAESLALLTSVMCGRGSSACHLSEDENDGASELGAPEDVFPTGSHVDEAEKDTHNINDDEKAILKEIREEIEKKVRDEMKEELNSYRRRVKEVENGWTSAENPFEKSPESDDDNLEDMDPKLKEAMIKMRKLDKILFEKIQIEKEVKRKRILLEKRMRQEIEDLTKAVTVPQDVKTNTDKFLALELPASHNEGLTVDEATDLPPVFQTQLEENEAMWRKRDGTEQNAQENTEHNGSARAQSSMKTTASSGRYQAKEEIKSRRQKKDFIKRNKELASNTDQSVLMTDDEKKRLAELLEGLDELPGPEDDASDITMSQLKACQATLQPGEGYSPDAAERKSLSNIDDQLKSLMPKEVYTSLLSARPLPQPPLFSRVGMQVSAASTDPTERFGERVLLETKEERELKAKLQEIEQELSKFRTRTEEESAEECHLTDEQLDNLLDQCARNLAMSQGPESSDLSARSVASSRQSLLENAPKLTNEQLEQLLSEAHFPMSSRLQDLREDDENLMEDEGSTETIKAETWKVIKDVNLNEPDFLDEKFPELAAIDRELQNFIDISNNANRNKSNNHNRNIFSNIRNTKDNPQHDKERAGEFVPISSPPNCSSYPFNQSSAFSAPASSILPRISQSNGLCRSDISTDSRSCFGTPINLSRDNSEDAIRLPDISTKSFLVHAYQGMSNASNKDRSNLPTRQSVDFMCDDFFEMGIDNISGDRDGEKEQSNGY